MNWVKIAVKNKLGKNYMWNLMNYVKIMWKYRIGQKKKKVACENKWIIYIKKNNYEINQIKSKLSKNIN